MAWPWLDDPRETEPSPEDLAADAKGIEAFTLMSFADKADTIAFALEPAKAMLDLAIEQAGAEHPDWFSLAKARESVVCAILRLGDIFDPKKAAALRAAKENTP